MIHYSKRFRKLPTKAQYQFEQRLKLFSHLMLHMHALSGKYSGCLSMNICGGTRTIF